MNTLFLLKILGCATNGGVITYSHVLDGGEASTSAAEDDSGVDTNIVLDTDTACPTLYSDDDQDTFGSGTAFTVVSCLPIEGFVANALDCDDHNQSAHPGSIEFCNGFDDNCDGATDEDNAEDATAWYADADHDADGNPNVWVLACYKPEGYTSWSADCDDTNPNVPASHGYEFCNGIDDNCDGQVDESTNLQGENIVWNVDVDFDGYGDMFTTMKSCTQPDGYVADASDCADYDPTINPSAEQTCDIFIDFNCNGIEDEPTTGLLPWYMDADGDSYGDPYSTAVEDCVPPEGYTWDNTDCDDEDALVQPYVDSDGDGFLGCDPSGGSDVDCNDVNATVNPDAVEGCTNDDLDCDGFAGIVGRSRECTVGLSCDTDGKTLSVTWDIDPSVSNAWLVRGFAPVSITFTSYEHPALSGMSTDVDGGEMSIAYDAFTMSGTDADGTTSSINSPNVYVVSGDAICSEVPDPLSPGSFYTAIR